MGWREVLAERLNDAQREWRNGERDTCSVGETVMALPPADRIALARELLAGTGWVVAREVGEKAREPLTGSAMQQVGKFAEVTGWNAARAAMLGDEG